MFEARVVIRRLPPNWTQDIFMAQFTLMPTQDCAYFVPADRSFVGLQAFSRAYVHFRHRDDMVAFKDKYDNCVFNGNNGTKYVAVVEYAPYQAIPPSKRHLPWRKKDPKTGTITTDKTYKSFLHDLHVQQQQKKQKQQNMVVVAEWPPNNTHYNPINRSNRLRNNNCLLYCLEMARSSPPRPSRGRQSDISAATMTPLLKYVIERKMAARKYGGGNNNNNNGEMKTTENGRLAIKRIGGGCLTIINTNNP